MNCAKIFVLCLMPFTLATSCKENTEPDRLDKAIIFQKSVIADLMKVDSNATAKSIKFDFINPDIQCALGRFDSRKTNGAIFTRWFTWKDGSANVLASRNPDYDRLRNSCDLLWRQLDQKLHRKPRYDD